MSAEDYQKLKVFLGKFFDWYNARPDMPAEIHTLYVAEGIERRSMRDAKRGLQMAINDTVEDTSNWTPDAIAAADARFSAAGTFTLSEVRRRYSKNTCRCSSAACFVRRPSTTCSKALRMVEALSQVLRRDSRSKPCSRHLKPRS